MTKKAKIIKRLEELGYFPDEDSIRVVKGPKVKMDIIECFTIWCYRSNDTRFEISSGYTMTELVKSGFTVVRQEANSQLYGEFTMEPLKQ